MEIPAGMPVAAVAAVEPDNVVVLILYPNAAQEAPFAALFQRRHIKHQAANLPEEFPPHVIELVVLHVEAIRVQEDHLQESAGDELGRERKEISDGTKDLFPLGIRVRQRD